MDTITKGTHGNDSQTDGGFAGHQFADGKADIPDTRNTRERSLRTSAFRGTVHGSQGMEAGGFTIFMHGLWVRVPRKKEAEQTGTLPPV